MVFYDQKDQTVSMLNESAFRTTPQGKDTAIANSTTTYALPITISSADIPIPIRVREEIYGIGSGKYPSKIINKTNEPIDVTLEGPLLLGTFLSYAVGQSYTSTGAQKETTYVDCVADVADSLDETYFIIYDGISDYHVWMDAAEDNTWTADPGGQGGGTIEVDFATNATATTVATAVAAAVNGDAKFSATSSGARVTILSNDTEKHTDAVDVDTNFRIFVQEQGVSASELAHRFTENNDYQMDSFTLHIEQRLTSENILYDLVGCVVDTIELSMSKDGGFINCNVGIKAAGYVAGIAQTSPPAELAIEPFVWGNLDNATTTSSYRFIDEANTERAPTAIESIKLKISNNIEFVPGIGDPIGAYAKSGKREIELNVIGFIENLDLWNYWRGTFDNTNERMNSASTKTSALLRLIRTAGTDLIVIYLHNLYMAEHDAHVMDIDETIKAVDMTLRAAQPDVDKRQIYSNEITSTTYTKVYFGNTDES
jgi:hypothetical protein